MSFLLGLAIGSMMSSGPNKEIIQPAAPSEISACLLANNYEEYNLCRAPGFWDELHYGSLHHYCDYEEIKENRECNIRWRTGMEWRGILRANGIKPR